MKTKGRPKSQNIQDVRGYFGSDAVDPDYWVEDRYADFLKQSLANPNPDNPQKFKQPLSIDQILQRQVNGR